jgi:hypothetical protein
MIYPITMYACKCDNCGKLYDIDGNGGGYAYEDVGSIALMVFEDETWHIEWGTKKIPDKHYCPDCFGGFDDEDKLIINPMKK